jgi:hypothetical protein
MKHDSMVEALRRRKAHGVDITISLARPDDGQLLAMNQEDGLGESQEDEEQELRDLDQAPDASPVGEDDDVAPEANPEEAEGLMDDELQKGNFGRGSLANFKHKQLSKKKV